MSDRVAVGCTSCGAQYAMPRQFLGKKASCKKCGQKFIAAELRQTATTTVQSAPPQRPPDRPTPVATAASIKDTIAARAFEIPAVTIDRRKPTPAAENGPSLDDSVVAWLNNPLDDDEEADILGAPPPPKVITTADMAPPEEVAASKSGGFGVVVPPHKSSPSAGKSAAAPAGRHA